MTEFPTRAKELIDSCLESGRICPQPIYWTKLWDILPNRKPISLAGWSPPAPLILAAWWETTRLEKTLRFQEHIRWADEHGAFEKVDSFLRSLTEENWFHDND